MNLNVIFTGQSNLTRAFDNGTLASVVSAAQAMLGFDGMTNTITLVGSDGTTAIGASNLLPESNQQKPSWLDYANGHDYTGGLVPGAYESAMMASIQALPAATRASPTMVIMAHNESDTSTLDGLSVPEEEAAILQHRADIDTALGQPATAVRFGMVFVPYDFIGTNGGSGYAQLGLAGNSQNVQVAEQDLAVDPANNMEIAARIADSDMDGTDPSYGGQHTSTLDQTNYVRMARAIAANFASYALPGSPVALAGSAWDVTGPQVTATSAVSGNTNQLLLTIALAQGSTALSALGQVASTGAGFAVVRDGVVNAATAAVLADPTHLLVTFASPVQTDGSATLHIGYGVGRIAQPEGPGHGSAVYDNVGLPLWADPNGVGVTSPASSCYVFGATGTETIYAANGTDTVSAGRSSVTVFAPASGSLTFLGGTGTSTVMGGAGSLLVSGGTGTVTVYAGTGPATVYGGLAGGNLLLASSGNTTLTGGGNNDTLVGGSGSNVLVAGPGTETLFANGQSTVYGGPGATTVVDAGTQTTVIGGAGSLDYWGGAGAAVVYGGSGAGSFAAGAGSMTLTEGTGTSLVTVGKGDLTVFDGAGFSLFAVNKGTAGGTATISGFKPGTDQISLKGFDAGEAARALSAAKAVSGGTMLTLSDGTRMTFVGIEHLSATSFTQS